MSLCVPLCSTCLHSALLCVVLRCTLSCLRESDPSVGRVCGIIIVVLPHTPTQQHTHKKKKKETIVVQRSQRQSNSPYHSALIINIHAIGVPRRKAITSTAAIQSPPERTMDTTIPPTTTTPAMGRTHRPRHLVTTPGKRDYFISLPCVLLFILGIFLSFSWCVPPPFPPFPPRPTDRQTDGSSVGLHNFFFLSFAEGVR